MQVTGMGGKDSLANLIFSDKITNNLPLSRSPPFCLGRSFTQMTTHTHTYSLSSAVLSAKSPDSLSRLWKQLKCYLLEKCWQNKHETLDTAYTEHRHTTPSKIDPLTAAKAIHKMPLLHHRIVRSNNKLNKLSDSSLFLQIRKHNFHFFFSPPFRIWVPTY